MIVLNLSIQLSNDDHFDYVIKRQRRKTIALHVLADASVEVRAPKWVPKFELVNFVEQRVSWIAEQRQLRLKQLASKPSYCHGQYHPYLGNTYPLHLMAGKRATVCFKHSVLAITVGDIENEKLVEKALQQWYRQQAKRFFEERMFECFEVFPGWFKDKYRVPNITIRKMRSRWGSCSSKGDVTLNVALIKLPIHCIDYVVLHELCHLEYFHHGKSFYRLLASVMPDWRDNEKLIEKLAESFTL